MLAWWYMGAWPSPGPPSTPNTSTGQPIPPGSMYFDTTLGTMLVWNGSTWVNASAPGKATTASLYYLAAAGQTVFPLATADRNGKTFAFNQTAPEGLQAFVNGVRLEPTFDFTVDTVGSSITFLRGLTLNALAIFDILTPTAQLIPSGTVNTVLLTPIVPDGVKTAFTGLTVASNGHAVNVAKNEELHVSVDGVIQAPGAAYTANAATITFAEAPPANANVFIVWFGPRQSMTSHAFDLALWLAMPVNVGDGVVVIALGPPFQSQFAPVAQGAKPGVAVGASMPAATRRQPDPDLGFGRRLCLGLGTNPAAAARGAAGDARNTS